MQPVGEGRSLVSQSAALRQRPLETHGGVKDASLEVLKFSDSNVVEHVNRGGGYTLLVAYHEMCKFLLLVVGG